MRLWLLSATDYSSGAMHFATCVADHTPSDDEQQRVWACERPMGKMVPAGHPRILRPPVILFEDGTVDESPIMHAMTISLGHCTQRLQEKLRETLLSDFPITVMEYEEGYVFHAQPFADPETVQLAFDSPEMRESFRNTQKDLEQTLRELLMNLAADKLIALLRYAADYGFDWLRLDANGPRIEELPWPK
jgi:hypothetical protein